jgi:ferrous iron transport protein B
VEEVQTIVHHHHSFGERMEEWSIHPVWGSLVALLVLAVSFSLVRLIGEFLISGTVGLVGAPWLLLPFGTEILFERVLGPLLTGLSGLLGSGSFLHRLLIGSLVDGRISFEQSFGLLSSGLFIPLGIVLPYLLSFYFVLALLEDSGYLPRLAVFLDNVMHRLGLHGYAIIPTLLGLGCNVPGILATRILETRRQRFVTATLISIAVPCAALQAMIVGVLGSRGAGPVLLVGLRDPVRGLDPAQPDLALCLEGLPSRAPGGNPPLPAAYREGDPDQAVDPHFRLPERSAAHHFSRRLRDEHPAPAGSVRSAG